MEWLKEIKVVVFDMDGTLYQEDTFLDRYVEYMLGGLEALERDEAIRGARQVLDGSAAVRFGHFYHRTDDLALARDQNGFVEAFTWDGRAVDPTPYASLPASSNELMYIGDPWGVANALRHRHRVSAAAHEAAFRQVREEMVGEVYTFPCDGALLRTLRELVTVEKKVLMTNTYESSAQEFLKRMNLLASFDEIVPEAKKPRGLEVYLEKLLAEGYEPHEVLSVGDNPWNDLYPAKRLGARTCFISPYPSVETEAWDVRLYALDELTALLRNLQAARGVEQMRFSS